MGWLTDLTYMIGPYAAAKPPAKTPAAGTAGIPLNTNSAVGANGQQYTFGTSAPSGPDNGGYGIDPISGNVYDTNMTPPSTVSGGSQLPLYSGGSLGGAASAGTAPSGGGGYGDFGSIFGANGQIGGAGSSQTVQNAVNSRNKLLQSQALSAQFNKSAQQAQAASQAQYQKLLASVAATQQAVNDNLTQMGKTGEANIARQQAIDTGKTEQDAVSRGLGNTTIRNQLLSGVTRNANDARTQLAEQLAQQRIAAQMQMGQMNGDAILSMQNQGPSPDYLQLLMQLASNGAGR